jgi:hypothetical protein
VRLEPDEALDGVGVGGELRLVVRPEGLEQIRAPIGAVGSVMPTSNLIGISFGVPGRGA